jgi:hypothetical protein
MHPFIVAKSVLNLIYFSENSVVHQYGYPVTVDTYSDVRMRRTFVLQQYMKRSARPSSSSPDFIL